MLNSILLHLDGDELSTDVVRRGVDLARLHRARIRGLSILDTRPLMEAVECESAGYVPLVQRSLAESRSDQQVVQAGMSKACLDAEVDFDVRAAQGDPIQLLSREAAFHDLIVTALPAPPASRSQSAEFRRRLDGVAKLVRRGVHPLLVLRGSHRQIQRMLLVYDGTPASGRSIRSVLQQRLFPDAEIRLLAIGRDSEATQRSLREMTDYVRPGCEEVEFGCLTGSPVQVLAPYAEKWSADLVVLGLTRTNPVLQRLWGESILSVLKRVDSAVYLHS